jgi:hypothetical protein
MIFLTNLKAFTKIKKPIRISTGEFGDSLVLDEITATPPN